MLRTIYWYFHFAFTVIILLPQLYKAKYMQKNKTKEEITDYVNTIVSKWAMSQIKVSGANIIMHGSLNIPNDKSVLFVSNHQSNFDIAIFMAYIPKAKGYISKIEMKKVPLIRTWMELMNCIFINRNDIKQTAEQMLKGIEQLKNGYSLVVFPEGTRSKGGDIADFKLGSFKLATKSKSTIVPVTINGSYKLMEQNKNMIKPADVDVYIHKPIVLERLSKEEIQNIAQIVKDIIAKPLT